jgi:hypothetical protein
MTKENRQKYIDVGLRMRNIELCQELLKKVLEVVDLVDRKKGKSNIQDIIELENKKEKRL